MNKPYIFGHRGASAYCIENTMECFRRAISFRVGIEADIHLTKDKILVCFHDPGFKINGKYYTIKNLTLKELASIKFKEGREIPTVNELFNSFSYCPENLRYSFDIGDHKTGLALIDLVEKHSYFEQVEITDKRIKLLGNLRTYNQKIKLVYTVPFQIIKIDKNKVDFETLQDNNIKILNIKYDRASEENFKNIIDNGFNCYCWGVNSKNRMKKVLNLRYKDEFVSAIYTDYPDILKKLRDKLFN
jgi:glycerophosphoryl diester phosphodiesterase